MKIMNSWAGEWGKKGYAWLPTEMLDWAEIAFPTKAQQDVVQTIMSSGEVNLAPMGYRKKKYRAEWEN